MDKNKIIYSICIEDIYTVAEQSLERKPTKEEIKFIEEKIGEHIAWYDVIEDLLTEFESDSIEENEEESVNKLKVFDAFGIEE